MLQMSGRGRVAKGCHVSDGPTAARAEARGCSPGQFAQSVLLIQEPGSESLHMNGREWRRLGGRN